MDGSLLMMNEKAGALTATDIEMVAAGGAVGADEDDGGGGGRGSEGSDSDSRSSFDHGFREGPRDDDAEEVEYCDDDGGGGGRIEGAAARRGGGGGEQAARFGTGGSARPFQAGPIVPRQKTRDELLAEKHEFLFKLRRLQTRGAVPCRQMSSDDHASDIKAETERLQREIDTDKSVKFQRSVLMSFATGVECLNSKFNVAGVKLDGWSESLGRDLENYDEVFEELHEKYASKSTMPPELKLVMMVLSSAFMFHMSQSLFRNAPGVEEVMRENPDIARQVAAAVAKKAGGPAADVSKLFTGRAPGGGPSRGRPGRDGASSVMKPPCDDDVRRVERLFSDADSVSEREGTSTLGGGDDDDADEEGDDIKSLLLDA